MWCTSMRMRHSFAYCGFSSAIQKYEFQAILYDVAMSAEQGRKAPYSADMRWRIIWQHFGMELTYTEVSERLNVSVSTVHSTCKKFENTGDVQSSKQPLRPQSRKLDENHERLLLVILIETPTLYLHQMCKHILDTTGVVVSEATICRLLRRHGFTRKKIRHVALQRSTELRALFMAQALSFPREFFVWVDETGSDARKIFSLNRLMDEQKLIA